MIDPRLLDTALHFRDDLFRNIVSLRQAQALYDDLSDDAQAGAVFARLEMDSKPRLPSPTLNRPFEPGYGVAIAFPFAPARWSATRFSDGTFGAWYGSTALETTVRETVFHARQQLLVDPGFVDTEPTVIFERRVYQVACDALLFDLRGKVGQWPALVAPDSYAFTQEVGRAVAGGGHPGLLTRSARCAGDNAVVFDARYLSNARDYCYLRYRFEAGDPACHVERVVGEEWLRV
ncbi:MAG TPA: RES family NAD+ phosphorylase [Nevskia sp.]|jgi:hypothetical protein|nr:RES family NAD+ phosphorylase [Nevskia sp.]